MPVTETRPAPRAVPNAAPAKAPAVAAEIDPMEYMLGMGKICASMGEAEASRDAACRALVEPTRPRPPAATVRPRAPKP
jgi:hypothetical protein